MIIVRRLAEDQGEAWEFRLESLSGGGGIVSVPAVASGYPIDWPPRVPAQARWLHEAFPQLEARAGAAWALKTRAWARLVSLLEAQEAAERS